MDNPASGSGSELERLQAELGQAKSEARIWRHRAAFDAAAVIAGVFPEAVAAAFTASGCKTESDEPDSAEIRAALDRLKQTRGWYFRERDRDRDRETAEPVSAPIKPAPGGKPSGGTAPPHGGRLTFAQLADPEFIRGKTNKELIALIKQGIAD